MMNYNTFIDCVQNVDIMYKAVKKDGNSYMFTGFYNKSVRNTGNEDLQIEELNTDSKLSRFVSETYQYILHDVSFYNETFYELYDKFYKDTGISEDIAKDIIYCNHYNTVAFEYVYCSSVNVYSIKLNDYYDKGALSLVKDIYNCIMERDFCIVYIGDSKYIYFNNSSINYLKPITCNYSAILSMLFGSQFVFYVCNALGYKITDGMRRSLLSMPHSNLSYRNRTIKEKKDFVSYVISLIVKGNIIPVDIYQDNLVSINVLFRVMRNFNTLIYDNVNNTHKYVAIFDCSKEYATLKIILKEDYHGDTSFLIGLTEKEVSTLIGKIQSSSIRLDLFNYYKTMQYGYANTDNFTISTGNIILSIQKVKYKTDKTLQFTSYSDFINNGFIEITSLLSKYINVVYFKDYILNIYYKSENTNKAYDVLFTDKYENETVYSILASSILFIDEIRDILFPNSYKEMCDNFYELKEQQIKINKTKNDLLITDKNEECNVLGMKRTTDRKFLIRKPFRISDYKCTLDNIAYKIISLLNIGKHYSLSINNDKVEYSNSSIDIFIKDDMQNFTVVFRNIKSYLKNVIVNVSYITAIIYERVI